MPDKLEKTDLRIYKSINALADAMSELLKRQKFAKITVNAICREAMISRATFYTHFADKYDLLKQWLANNKSEIISNADSYEVIKNRINAFAESNSRVIRNLLEGANSETSDLLCDFILSLLDIYTDKNNNGQMNPKYIVLSEFCGGGLMNYLKWQVENRFPEDLQIMNSYLYDLLLTLLKWYAEQE